MKPAEIALALVLRRGLRLKGSIEKPCWVNTLPSRGKTLRNALRASILPTVQGHLHLHLNLHLGFTFIQSDFQKYICQKKGQQYIADGTLRRFIEPSANHYQSRVRHFTVHTISQGQYLSESRKGQMSGTGGVVGRSLASAMMCSKVMSVCVQTSTTWIS